MADSRRSNSAGGQLGTPTRGSASRGDASVTATGVVVNAHSTPSLAATSTTASSWAPYGYAQMRTGAHAISAHRRSESPILLRDSRLVTGRQPGMVDRVGADRDEGAHQAARLVLGHRADAGEAIAP